MGTSTGRKDPMNITSEFNLTGSRFNPKAIQSSLNQRNIIKSELNKTNYQTIPQLYQKRNPMDLYNTQKIPLKAIKTSPKLKFELALIPKDHLVANRMHDLPLAVDTDIKLFDHAYMTCTEHSGRVEN